MRNMGSVVGIVLVLLGGLAPVAHAENRFVLDEHATRADLAIDAAGNGYFAWIHDEDLVLSPRFCKVPAGSTCTAPVALDAGNLSVGTVHPLVGPDGTVRVVGTASSLGTKDVVVLWTSADGGATFPPATIIRHLEAFGRCCGGNALLQGANVLFPLEGDTAFTSTPVTGDETGFAELSTDSFAIHSSVALDPGGRPVVAWMENSQISPHGIFVSRYAGAGDPNATSSWEPKHKVTDGNDPSLAGGPSGLFLVSLDAPEGQADQTPDEINVRKLGADGFGKPELLDVEPNAIHYDLAGGDGSQGRIFQTPGTGRVLVAWRDGVICPKSKNGICAPNRPSSTDDNEAIRLFASDDGGGSFHDEGVVAYDRRVQSIRLAANDAGQGWVTFFGTGDRIQWLQVADLRTTSGKPTGKGALSGRIVNLGKAPVSGLGAEVTVCRGGRLSTCRTDHEKAGGSFSFPGLAAGVYTVEANTDEGGFTVQATAEVTAGQTTTKDLDVCAPAIAKVRLFSAERDPARVCAEGAGELALDGGFSIQTPAGRITRGAPAVSNQEPFSLRIPVDIPAEYKPDTTKVFVTVGMVEGKSAKGFAGGAEVHMAGVVIFAIHYGANGLPDTISNIIKGQGTPERDAATTADLFRAATLKADRCQWGIAPSSGGGVQLSIAGVHFPFDPIALPPPPPSGDIQTDKNLLAAASTFNLALNVTPGVGEYNTYVQALNAGYRLEDVHTRADAKSLVSDTIVNVGIPAFAGIHANRFDGSAISTAIQAVGEAPGSIPQNAAPDPCDNGVHSATTYIDPSGFVKAGKVPVAGAKVVLTRAAEPKARQKRVPNGSAIMSPSNRRNPDRTDSNGHFGWDVLPGFYRVEATRKGCRAAKVKRKKALTRVFAIPPAVTDARLNLRCRGLRRAKSTVRTAATPTGAGPSGTGFVLTAAVKGKGKRSGTITFRDGKRVLAVQALDSSTGQATTSVVVPPGAHRFSARFSGNAFLKPGSAPNISGEIVTR